MKSLKLTLLLGVAVAAMNLTAIAGPGSEVFRPLTSKQQISALKPGTRIAHECPHCGAIDVSKVGKDKSHAEAHTCPVCKMTITYSETSGGKVRGHSVACVDVKTGKKMTARVCAAHK